MEFRMTGTVPAQDLTPECAQPHAFSLPRKLSSGVREMTVKGSSAIRAGKDIWIMGLQAIFASYIIWLNNITRDFK
jgi:hypothetical protein